MYQRQPSSLNRVADMYREMRNELASAEERFRVAETSEEEEVDKLDALQAELSTLEKDLDEHRRRAKEALQCFEGSSLRKGARLVPFPNIYRCEKGHVVRVRQEQIQEMASRYGRDVKIDDAGPSWSEQEQGRKDPRLYRVLEVSPERLVLSRAQAYSSTPVEE